jgi:hypothetical protein
LIQAQRGINVAPSRSQPARLLRLLASKCLVVWLAMSGCSIDVGKLRRPALDGAGQPWDGHDGGTDGLGPDGSTAGRSDGNQLLDDALGGEVPLGKDAAIVDIATDMETPTGVGDAPEADGWDGSDGVLGTVDLAGGDGDDDASLGNDTGIADTTMDSGISTGTGGAPEAGGNSGTGGGGAGGATGQGGAMDAMDGLAASYDTASLDGAAPDANSLLTGLIGHWTFDEGSGDKVADSSGNGITGTLVDGPRWSDSCAPTKAGGRNVACLHFDGSTQSVVLADAPVANFSGAISMSAWIKTDAGKTGMRDIFAHGYTTNPSAEVYVRMQDNAYAVGSFDGRDHQAVSNTGANDIGLWVHIAAVYDGRAWLLYRNGRLEASRTEAVGAVRVGVPWSIGAATSGNGRFFNGSIDDVRLYDRPLSADEVASLAQGL